MADAKIIVAAHKEYWMPSDPIYLPLQVGAAKKKSVGFKRDNSGKTNISKKNATFCELTGLYWAWKNLDNEYIGLVHYRRHFSVKGFAARHSGHRRDAVLTGSQLDKLLEKHDIIIPKRRHYFIETLYTHYAHTHYREHLDQTLLLIQEKYPEYERDFHHAVNQTSGHMFNMMIMKRRYLDEYCSWIFNFLFELEDRIDTSLISCFHKRLYGRISEILLNVWLEHQLRTGAIKRSQIKVIPYMYMEKVNWGKKILTFLRAKFLGRRYDGSM